MKNNIIKLTTEKGDRQQQLIQDAKWGYTTRCIPSNIGDLYIHKNATPKAGDLVLATVKRLGHHKRIELVSGRRARMFVEDAIVVVYGNRYAPDHFEAIVPEDLKLCHLVAAGGIAGQMIYKHASMKLPTKIEPVGLLTHANGKVLSTLDYGLEPRNLTKSLPPVIAVVGGSMNAGKTTTAAGLVRGLTRAGFKVTAGKVTGTGSGGDTWHLSDAGAHLVFDFLDAGHPSTYLLPPRKIEEIFNTLISNLGREDTDFIILEVADGLFQTETSKLLTSEIFHTMVNGVLYAASDALNAVHGVELLQRWGLPVFAVSGVVTRSPLAIREILDVIDIPVLARKALTNPLIEDHIANWLSMGTLTVAGGENT